MAGLNKAQLHLEYFPADAAKMTFSSEVEISLGKARQATNLSRSQTIQLATDNYRDHVYSSSPDRALFELGKRLTKEIASPTTREKSRTPENSIDLRYQRESVIRYSEAIIAAAEEALEYDPKRHHNQTTPALWSNSTNYKEELENLAAEMRKLNALLVSKRTPQDVPRAKIHYSKYFDKFLTTFASSLGKGAAALLIGSMASALVYLGATSTTIDAIWGHLKSSE